MQAIWLATGREPVQIALRDGQVSVQAGVLHGHYHTYEDKEKGRKHLMIALCTDQRYVLDFGHQMPYHMKLVTDGAFRTYAKDHILVHRNIDHDVTAARTQWPAHDEDGVMRWIEDFVYMHPGKPETSLRIGISGANEFKVSWNGEAATGTWRTYRFLPGGGKLPSGIDTARRILMLKFHNQGNTTRETNTLYGALEGATHVFRAIGSMDKNSRVRVYKDAQLRILKDWHIVLVATYKDYFA